MPIYEFRCLECGELFEKLFVSGVDKEVEIACPKCRSKSFERVMSRSSHIMGSSRGARPKLTEKSCSSGNSCVTLDIPGAD